MTSIDPDLLNALNAIGQNNQPQPLGVPVGYTAKRPGQTPVNLDPFEQEYILQRGGNVNITVPGIRQIPARYFDGNEYDPASGSLSDVLTLQQALEAGGWYTSGANYTAGVWDEESILAYRKALITANASGLDIKEVLDIAANQPRGGKVSGGGAAAPLLPNPEDIRVLGNQTAQAITGAYLTPDQQTAFIDAFYSAYHPGGGYATPSPDTIAEQQIRAQQPVASTAHDYTKAFGTLEKMLGGVTSGP